MNNFQIRAFVRQVIAEAKDKKAKDEPKKKAIKKEEKAPKSSGKLIDLKKELAALKQYKNELQVAKFAEKTAETEVEFADLAKFAKELDTIKAKGVALEKQIDDKIAELETRISDEKNKIKEMMGLTSDKKDSKKMMGEERGDKGRQHSAKSKDYGLPYTPKTDYRVGQKFHHSEHGTGEIIKVEPTSAVTQAKEGATIFVKFVKKDEQGNNVFKNITLKVKTLPSTMRENELEEARFPKGTDIGKPGKGFEKIAKSAAKKYGSKEAGQKVAGAILKKVVKK